MHPASSAGTSVRLNFDRHDRGVGFIMRELFFHIFLLMKLDPRLDASVRERIRDDCRSLGIEPHEKLCGISREDFVLGGAAFQRWLFDLQVDMWSRVGLNEGVLATPLSAGIPEKLDDACETLCRARAEMLFLLDLLPEHVLKQVGEEYLKLLFGPVETLSALRPIEEDEIKRIIWHKVVMTDGEAEFSNDFKESLRALWLAIWPEFDGSLTQENLLKWQSFLADQEEPAARRVCAFLKRTFRRF